jgi:S1-C subfamily serine protease
MSDEPPVEDHSADEAPTKPEPAVEGREQPQAQAQAQPTPPKRRGVFLPWWVAIIIAALLLAGGGFAIGRGTAPGGDHENDRVRIERRVPRGPELPRNPGGEPNPGSVPRPASGVILGVATRDATGTQTGAEIIQVLSGSAADQAGLKVGDVITALDGNAVSGTAQLRDRLRTHQPGDQVKITYTRSGSSSDTTVTLGSRSAVPSASS